MQNLCTFQLRYATVFSLTVFRNSEIFLDILEFFLSFRNIPCFSPAFYKFQELKKKLLQKCNACCDRTLVQPANQHIVQQVNESSGISKLRALTDGLSQVSCFGVPSLQKVCQLDAKTIYYFQSYEEARLLGSLIMI